MRLLLCSLALFLIAATTQAEGIGAPEACAATCAQRAEECRTCLPKTGLKTLKPEAVAKICDRRAETCLTDCLTGRLQSSSASVPRGSASSGGGSAR